MTEVEKNVKNLGEDKKPNIITKTLNKMFNKDEGEFSAEMAWLSTTYGVGANRPIEERIANKQKDIMNVIKSKFRYSTTGQESNSNYRCVVDIEEDLAAVKDVVMTPFIEKGFKVINLSEKIDEVKDENIYLISWKNIFRHTK
jgi:hypothetical protein